MMEKRRHDWTWEGVPVDFRILAVKCGFNSTGELYGISKIIKSDEGVEILKYKNRKRVNSPTLYNYEGEILTLAQLANKLKIPKETLRARIKRYGIDSPLIKHKGQIPVDRSNIKRKSPVRNQYSDGEKPNWYGLPSHASRRDITEIKPLGSWERAQLENPTPARHIQL